MICLCCQANPIHAELQALSKRACCLACATAIAEALPRLKTQPCRRQTICMRLQEQGLSGVKPYDPKLADLANWEVTDEQITGACDIAREKGSLSFGYVYAILRNEYQRHLGPNYVKTSTDKPMMLPMDPVKPKEDWERLGFANQADYEAWQFAYDKDRRSGRRITEVEHRRNWLSPAI